MEFRRITALLLSCLLLAVSCEKDDSASSSDDGKADYTLTQAKSAKRGVSFSFGQIPEYDVPLLQSAITWSYDWSSRVPIETVDREFTKYGLDWCPMIWNGNYNPDNIRQYKQKHPEAKYILAFNEPNLTDQANMVPSKAAEYWPAVVSLAKELGMKIISPALNYGTLEGYHDPIKWMDEFLAQPGVSLDDMDGIALHCYMPSASSVKKFIDMFAKYGKPIWLTEFCNGNSNNISEEAQLVYMCETLNMLEAHPNVFRYAWFMPRGGFNSRWHNNLLTSESPFELTTLGKVFVHFPTLDKNIWYKAGDVIPAEQYVYAEGSILLEPSTDGGVLDISKLSQGGSVEYQIDMASAGTYSVAIRYLTYMESSLGFAVNGETVASKKIPNTEKQWKTSTLKLDLPAGKSTLRLTGQSGAAIRLNWLRIKNN